MYSKMYSKTLNSQENQETIKKFELQNHIQIKNDKNLRFKSEKANKILRFSF